MDGLVSFLIAALALIAACEPVSAATERVVDYEYDAAGNIVRIITQEQSDPPVVGLLTPNFINLGQTRTITTSGSSLLGVDVTTDAPGLSINAVDSDGSQVTFQLTASNQAPIGTAIIRFTTGLGEVQQSIFVAEVGPGLATDPSPITIDLSATSNTVTLDFSIPRPEDETYSLSVMDTATAVADTSSFTILAGESQASISLTGVSDGATVLQIDLPAKFYSYRFPVYVNKTYAELLSDFPDMQQRNLFAEPVAVVVQANNPYLPNTVTSGPVGVVVDSSSALFSKAVGVVFGDVLGGRLLSKPVGIVYGDTLGGGLLSKPVGVNVSSTVNYAYTSPVGAIYGPYLTGNQPAVAPLNSIVNFEVSGFNLAEVLTVAVSPGDDVDVGTITTNPEETLLTVPVTIDLLASPGPRELILEDVNGPIIFGPGLPLTFEIQ